ncbi:MAG: ABC transporter substrate-binding protein, partial [Acidobacteria bacterium]|nr:ABC transporter substrate-binding protein [Acidobacteriota bacterium]
MTLPVFRFRWTRLALALGIACVCAAPALAARAPITVKDLRGRSVTIPAPATRLLIDDSRFLVALDLIHPQPASLIAAWPHDVNRLGDRMYEQFKAVHPALATAPRVASSAGTFSLEQVLDVKPDVAIFSLGRGPTDAQLKLLETAGVPVVFIDFFVQPFENQEPSLLILGALIGRESEAKAFASYRRARLDAIAARVAKATGPRPKVFMEMHAGMSPDCCNS